MGRMERMHVGSEEVGVDDDSLDVGNILVVLQSLQYG
jgi:hypothetical protein